MSYELIPSRGAFRSIDLEVVREITPADIIALANAPKVPQVSPLKLRAIHHNQARLLAQGKAIKEVALLTGRTPQSITDLQKSPAFVDLVSYYSDQINTAALEDAVRIKAKLVDAAEVAVDEIQDRLEDEAKRKSMPIGELRKIAELGLDRTVAPPQATPSNQPPPPVQMTFNIGGNQPKEVKKLEPPTIEQDEGEKS